MNDLETFIVDMCNKVIESLKKSTPKTKRVTLTENLENMNPLDLVKFIDENNIPNTCYFSTTSSCDYSYEYPCLCWDVDIECNQKDSEEYFRKTFLSRLRKFLSDNCASFGFYRKYGYPSTVTGKYYGVDFYKEFTTGNIDCIVYYFSNSFTPLNK